MVFKHAGPRAGTGKKISGNERVSDTEVVDGDTRESRQTFVPVPVSGLVSGPRETAADSASSGRARGAASNPGLPEPLRAGIEQLSGLVIDDVRVHFDSPKPAVIHALAYTEGSDVYLAPGRDQDLPHEAWHVVQQKQGRVRAESTLPTGARLNRDATLEREADRMGAAAASARPRTALVGESARVPGPEMRRTQAWKVIQANGMVQAFTDGARVVMAGETHGKFKHQLEKRTWEAFGYDVLYEGDQIEVQDADPVVLRRVRLDTPYLGVLSCGSHILEAVSPKSLTSWLDDDDRAARAKWLFDVEDDLKIMRKFFVECRREATEEERRRGLVDRAWNVVERAHELSAAVGAWHQLADAERTTHRKEIVRSGIIALAGNLHVTTAAGLEADGVPGDFVNQLPYVRSVKMLMRLNAVVDSVTRPTIWKVGSAHIDDIERKKLPREQGVMVMQEEIYNAAYMDALQQMQ